VNVTTADVDAYGTRVRAALADLPAADRDDLLADLEDHLAEVAAEGPLDELLGTPEAYAAELRSSAGLPSGGATGPGRWQELTAQPWLRPTLDFLPELRPGWWVLRGVLVAWIASMWPAAGLPAVVALSVLLVPASVLLGRRSVADPRLRWAGIAASVAAVVALLLFLALVGSADGSGVEEPYPASDTSGLSGVTNLYPYDKDGRPLTDVQLYDQDGNPVELTGDTDSSGNLLTRVPRTATDGLVVPNVYPQRQQTEVYEVDGTTRQREVTPPAVRAPKLSAG
jgi:hypothetical protein